MAEKLTDIELSGIVLDETKPRVIGKDPSYNVLQEDDIETPFGNIHVAVQGDRSRPAIITYHDIGLNHITCFQGFFNFHDIQPMLRHFCIYHVNAPGQQEGASNLVLNDANRDEQQNLLSEAQRRGSLTKGASEKKLKTGYATMDQLAEILMPVLQYYQIKRFIGFGVGAGGNILTRFAISYPDKVDALFLVETISTPAGWSEWFYQNVNMWYLKGGQLTNFTEEYLLWHWFGKDTKDRNHDLVHVYKENIKMINTQNLAMFIDSYMHRTDLGLNRPTDTPKRAQKQLKCNIMLVTGAVSPHHDEVVNMNGRLDPQNSQWLNVSDCGGMPLEEQPATVCEAFRLFLQGMGHIPQLSQTKIVAEREIARRASLMDHSSEGPVAASSQPAATVC